MTPHHSDVFRTVSTPDLFAGLRQVGCAPGSNRQPVSTGNLFTVRQNRLARFVSEVEP